MPGPVALHLRAIRATYGTVVAVDGLTLAVRRGECVALVGHNGSGKSTTLGIAAGLIEPATGTAEIEGIRQTVDPLRYASKVGFVPQDAAVYDELTAIQNLEFFGRIQGLRGLDLDSRIARALGRSRLLDRGHARVETFSGGLRRRLGIAIALLHDPPVVLLDEPTAALDPASRDELAIELHRLRDDGHAILLTTHHLDEAERTCDRIVALEHGRIATERHATEPSRSRSGGRGCLFGHLRDPIPKYLERRVRLRIDPDVEFEITGRRIRLSAWTPDDLGRALAILLSEGVRMDRFRSASDHRSPLVEAA
jgi:ABC-2 type transport system ATP-binding protein